MIPLHQRRSSPSLTTPLTSTKDWRQAFSLPGDVWKRSGRRTRSCSGSRCTDAGGRYDRLRHHGKALLRQPHASITKGLGLSSCARTRQTAAPRADQWNRSRHLKTSSSFKGCDVPEEEGHQRSSEVVVVVFRRRRRRRRHSRRSGLPQRIAPPAGLWRRRGHAKTRHALKSGRHTVKAEHNFKGGGDGSYLFTFPLCMLIVKVELG